MSVIPTINPAFKDKFKYLHIQAYDDDYQDIKMYFDETNLFIKNCLHEGGRILIHCMVGRSRSVTIFIAFLIFIIKGGINQCIVVLNNENYEHNMNNNTNDICNIIEYNKLIDSKKTQKEYKDNNNYNNKNTQNTNNLNDEKISSIDNELPKLSKKEENFVLYKKQKMITDVDELISNYKILKKELDNYKKQIFIDTEESQEIIKNMKKEFSTKMLNNILQYVKSHRSCISPNLHFRNQLGDLLF